MVEETCRVFTGYNINIDVVHGEKFELDQPPELKRTAKTIDDLKSALRYCKERNENHEIDYSNLEIEGGKRYIGGQGGIVANYLADTENEVILYTPSLSEELAEIMSEKILYPVKKDDIFYLKNIQDAVNSDKTKINHIFEFKNDRSGRLILSGKLQDYEPYLPAEIEEELPLIQGNIDCCVLSGFHNTTGNKVAKMKKAGKQLSEIHKPVHVEYAHKDRETTNLIIKHIIPKADSLGLDETELKELSEILEIKCPDSPNFGESFKILKDMLEKLGLARIHLHTYNYHITMVEDSYPVETERIRDSMLYGELSAIQSAEKGRIPDSDDIKDFSMENKNIQDTQELQDFGDFHNLENFAEEGTAKLEDVRVAGIPIVKHHDPERTVGMGDIISSGAFSHENADV
jgi:ADP-dependent phosphofructokinase/glucokinase